MKKNISLIAVALLAVSMACSAETLFFGSGATGADIVIAKGNGTISAQDVLFSIETNATATVHRGKVMVPASAASTSTNITITTTATNTVGGVVLTTSDYLIVGTQLRDISVLAPVAGGLSTVVTVTAAATVTLNQPVYVCDAGDALSLYATTTWSGAPIPFLFKGFNGAPAAISVPTTAGATVVSGRAAYR